MNVKQLALPGVAVWALSFLGCGADFNEDSDAVGELSSPAGAVEASLGNDDSSSEPSTNDGDPTLQQFRKRCELSAIGSRIDAAFEKSTITPLDEIGKKDFREPVAEPGLGKGRMLKRAMRAYDIDGSRDLSQEERQVLETDLQIGCVRMQQRLIEEFDVNNDQELDEVEWTAARRARDDRRSHRQSSFRQAFDANGDAALSQDEWQQALETRRGSLRKRFDVNNDGLLDDQEKAAVRDQIRRRVRGETKFPR